MLFCVWAGRLPLLLLLMMYIAGRSDNRRQMTLAPALSAASTRLFRWRPLCCLSRPQCGDAAADRLKHYLLDSVQKLKLLSPRETFLARGNLPITPLDCF